MTVEEMAQRILQTIKDRPATTLVEIVNACGAEALGEFMLTFPGFENAVLWTGVSEKFGQAWNLIRQQTTCSPSHWMVYMMDGGMLDLPIMKNNIRSLKFKKPTWCPVVLSLKKTKAEEAA
jgi:hypothetical protein